MQEQTTDTPSAAPAAAEESAAADDPFTAPTTAQLCDNATHHLPNLTSYFMTGTGLALEVTGEETADGKVPVTLTFSVADAAPLAPFIVNTPPSLHHGALNTAEFLAEWADISGNLTSNGLYANPGAALSAQCYGAYGQQAMLSAPNAALAVGGARAVLDITSVELASEETVVMQALLVLRPRLEPESGCHARQAASASHYHFFDGCPAVATATLPASSLLNASTPTEGPWTLAIKLGAGVAEEMIAGGGEDAEAGKGSGDNVIEPDADPDEPENEGPASADSLEPAPKHESAGLNEAPSGDSNSGSNPDSLLDPPKENPVERARDAEAEVRSCCASRLAPPAWPATGLGWHT